MLELTDKALERKVQNYEWLLRAYRILAQTDPDNGVIDRIAAPSHEAFVKNYLSKNRPVILTDAIDHWPLLKTWTPEYFRSHHGDTVVEVQLGRDSDPNYERQKAKHTAEMTLGELTDKILATESSNDFYMTAVNYRTNKDRLTHLWGDMDGLNIGDDYLEPGQEGSVWYGPRGTVTPLHFDLINNFFCQIYGRKHVRMIPSWEMPLMYHSSNYYSDVDLLNPDYDKYPLFKEATIYDFVVGPGDVLFIPFGWWHHLVSLDPSISVTRKNPKPRLKANLMDGLVR